MDEPIIDPRKLTDYLLVQQVRGDKSRYLAQAGFARERPHELESEIRRLSHHAEMIEEQKTPMSYSSGKMVQ
ncbi:MAG: hypothetical protein SGI88_08270 [Candidatus Hydrogenedentes bacterium]|nr:hypothetical protein [Candidatus Hydrogenedentota bacterium]